eukprot:10432-Heterococcus_DN1.PRE.3
MQDCALYRKTCAAASPTRSLTFPSNKLSLCRTQWYAMFAPAAVYELSLDEINVCNVLIELV